MAIACERCASPAATSGDIGSRAAVGPARVLVVPGRGPVLDAAVDAAAVGREDLAVRRVDEQVAARVLVDHGGAAGELAHVRVAGLVLDWIAAAVDQRH